MQLSNGDDTSCARLSDGTLRCWGKNDHGQLGYGNETQVGDDEAPAAAGPVPAGGAASDVALGGPSCAIFADGGVRCWGDNAFGGLGYGNGGTDDIGDDETPASVGVLDLGGRATQLSASRHTICALLEDGSIRCWGSNSSGQLGYGHDEPLGAGVTPAQAGPVDVGGLVRQISVGDGVVCALLVDGAVRCWGANGGGQLGLGHTNPIGDNEVPASVAPVEVGGKAVQVTTDGLHSCALLEGGLVRCWGYNEFGALGNGGGETIGDDEVPASVAPVDLGAKATYIASAGGRTCALLEGGSVRCWGYNGNGQLGLGHTSNLFEPSDPIDLGGPVRHLSLGPNHSCALLEGGSVRCWGINFSGQLGLGHTDAIGNDEPAASAPPVQVF